MLVSNKPLCGVIFRFLALSFILSFHTSLSAQENRDISVWQYRRVPDNKRDEFIKRETTYWAKVAESAAKQKKMTFWALLEKVGGYDLPNSSNFLFINTFPNIDDVGDVFTTSKAESVAGVKMAAMETGSMSTVTSEFFLHSQNWAQHEKAVPAKDFNYIVMNYQNTDYPDSMINLEKMYWQPFIQKAMNANQTPQKAWGNATVLAPAGDNIKFTTVSYDLFATLHDALYPNWASNMVFPTSGLELIGKIAMNRRGISVYRIVKVVQSPQ
jgi:hypothetical protein